jgi:hypothetical protein
MSARKGKQEIEATPLPVGSKNGVRLSQKEEGERSGTYKVHTMVPVVGI